MKMSENQLIGLLSALLNCGYRDLEVIENCKYDFEDLIEEVKDMGYEKPDLNNLAYAMFVMAKRDMQESIKQRIDDLESEEEISEEQQAKLEVLKQLEPHEDIESFHNYLDTSVYFTNNEDIYREYCSEEIKKFEEMTGFSL